MRDDIDWFGNDLPTFVNTKTPSFRFHRTFSDIPDKNFLVDGFLAKNEVSCFFGEPGATKSTLALDLACHVAGGIPWMGRNAGYYQAPGTYSDGTDYPEGWFPADVLYVALERADQVQRRVEAFTDEHNLQEPLRLAIYDGELDFVNDDSDRLTQIVSSVEAESCAVEHPAGEDGYNIAMKPSRARMTVEARVEEP